MPRALRLLPLLVALLSVAAWAQSLKLPSLVSHDMVVQREMPIRIWGWADAGSTVTVRMGSATATTQAGPDRRFLAELPALAAGGPHEIVISSGSQSLTVRNVLVGDVWVCSGQSNMEWPLRSSTGGNEAAAEDLPNLRLFTVGRHPNDVPMDDCQGKWTPSNAQTAAAFSAVGFHFGRHLQQELNVPIGLINSSWGGTAAQVWTDARTLAASEEFRPWLDERDRVVRAYTNHLLKNREALLAWLNQAQATSDSGGSPTLPPPGMLPADPRSGAGVSSFLYNGMVHPLTVQRIRGVIWYQGEANASGAERYRRLFPALIQSWRQAWGQGDFPFLFVQLANYMARGQQPEQSAWAELREAQAMTLKLPHTGMAVAIDIGDAGNIHPANKRDVGVRLALAALKISYGRDIVHSGPMYRDMSVEGDRIRVRFNHVGGGLEARGGKLTAFAIAGEDRNFVWAEATIDGDSVLVRSPDVAKPVAVRYAWANNPAASLYNREGLPASPFRTDDWPMITQGR